MKENDICKVLKDKGRGHPKGSRVQIILVSRHDDDPEPYYCKSEDGATCYWYAADELEVIEREGLI